MKRTIYLILFALLTVPQLYGQTLKAFLTEADKATQEKDFYNANHFYQQILEFDTSSLAMRYKYGESSKSFNAFKIAEEQFSYVAQNDSQAEFPLATYYLAEVQQLQGNYEESKRNYELFLSEIEDDQVKYQAKAEKEIEAINWAIENNNNTVEGVTVEHLGGEINSPYADFGAVAKGDELYYSSHRYETDNDTPSFIYGKLNTRESEATSNSDSNSIKAIKDSLQNLALTQDYNNQQGVYNTVGKRSRRVSQEEGDSPQSETHSSFNEDGSRMYYTVCEYLNLSDLRCDIYVKSITETGQYSKARKLPDHINSNENTSTQPNIAINKLTGEEGLYFASDREGGKGKIDIWYSKIEGDEYSQPINLTDINTAEDDVTPFFHSATNTLYFSSAGYLGFGGLDIYQSSFIDGAYLTPINLQAPTNTSFNDLYYTLNEPGTIGYMSSNRIGSMYLDESFEACCFDIYKLNIEEILIELNALTFDSNNQEELLGARVRIIDAITGEILYEKLNELGHDHKFSLKCNREYIIITEKDGYEADTTNLSTKDCDKNEEIIKKIYLSPKEVKLEVLTFDRGTQDILKDATVVLYDLSDPSKAPITVTGTNRNDLYFDIIAGREYKLVATRQGYDPQTIVFNATDITGDRIIKKIYFDKSKVNLNSFLPLAVYFDNDNPNSRSRKLYTNLSYSDTYYPYIAKKDEFKREYANNMNGDIKSNAQSELEFFFESDVTGGFNRMQTFIGKLKEQLDKGQKIEIALKGFASPRAANRYNLALGQRRIWTIKNELKQYAGGILAPYLESGNLQVVEVSYGEEASPKSISDSYKNKRLSVYSVEASRQRKAEIVKARVIN